MDRSSISGFSILEIFVTILIISISAIVITFFTRSTIGNYSNARQTEAAYISGEEKLSELNAAPVPENGTDVCIVENDTFTRTWTVSTSTSPHKAVVDVNWSLLGKSRAIKVYGVIQ